MTTTIVLLSDADPNGVLADINQPLINIEDQGLTRGDGVFETMLAANRSVRKFDAHLERMANSAALLDLPMPSAEQWKAAVATALTHAEQGATTVLGEEHTVKLIISRGTIEEGPHAWVSASASSAKVLKQREEGVKAMLLPRGHDPAEDSTYPWLLAGAKTLSYAVNMSVLRYVASRGADDAIWVTEDRRILEGATSSVLVAKTIDGVSTLFTPEPNHGILPGTTQGAIFAGAREAGWQLGYGPLYPQDLFEAEGVWLASSVRLLAPVTHLNGTVLAVDASTTEELMGYLARG
ncbi:MULTISPECIES: aminotransferase class IV [unclassified Rothia (in: high G+C Gram-positive bacteria)]|uniref:aminotransferase class IV n=1 Tax=unclassified Rothia (in: high G+C Gram-positive bacteria) TaxID=2689056 RepID=UPI00195D5115|nr:MULTISPECIES: aminotransferase class IV [unclassified Rothia (in: high G+C Gram-positive bacteria)]MBM7051509.1 aminotransferase class IV [Rothia sp. ZJ1223]QRZ61293.1 aminotransferase class IV [Rothia sp. ZJ932]